jgi:hypothetical protein
MADYEHQVFAWPPPDTERCWMCGTRLPVTQMVADGGSACNNVRWYCLNVRVCTARWTRRATPDSGRGAEQVSSARAAAGA